MNNLDQGDLPGARALHEQALAVGRRVLVDEHPKTLTIVGNRLVTLSKLGDSAAVAGVLVLPGLTKLRQTPDDALPVGLVPLKQLLKSLSPEPKPRGFRRRLRLQHSS